MKTNDQLETLIQNLIERMNRVECASAQSIANDAAMRANSNASLQQTIDAVIAQTAKAIESALVQNEYLEQLAIELSRGR